MSRIHISDNSLKGVSQTKSNLKILVVDDSHPVRLALHDGLSAEGYKVHTVGNGKEAIDAIAVDRPDLILADIYMPEMDGFELCSILHESAQYADIPFVVMSTVNDAKNMGQMMRYGAAAFIIKPFNIEQLIITLNNIFSYEFLLLLKEKERLDSEQKLLLAGVASLIRALEARDSYTRGHSERVARILSGLVKQSGGTSSEIERSLLAGQLHDIGKIGIRDNVLLKPGRLDYDEYLHIKQHPSIGAAIIRNIPSISDILPVVLSHHERVDRNGYPQGLGGSNIPLWARMTAIADTYDALVTHRSYRRAVSHDKAIMIIKDVSGTQLCPDCVKLFFEWVKNEQAEMAA